MRTVRRLTVRGGWSLVLVIAALVAGCSDNGDDGATTTSTSEVRPAALPDDVDPGRAFLLLGGALQVFTVTSCQLEPVSDTDTGVTTELRLDATADDGTSLVAARTSFTADATTVTDTITLVDDGGEVLLESSRAETGGRQIDLRDPNPVGSLLEIDAGTGAVRADGVFGPFGGRADDPANVEGALLARCP